MEKCSGVQKAFVVRKKYEVKKRSKLVSNCKQKTFFDCRKCQRKHGRHGMVRGIIGADQRIVVSCRVPLNAKQLT